MLLTSRLLNYLGVGFFFAHIMIFNNIKSGILSSADIANLYGTSMVPRSLSILSSDVVHYAPGLLHDTSQFIKTFMQRFQIIAYITFHANADSCVFPLLKIRGRSDNGIYAIIRETFKNSRAVAHSGLRCVLFSVWIPFQ